MSIKVSEVPGVITFLICLGALQCASRPTSESCATHLQAKPAAFANNFNAGILDTVTICTGYLTSVPLNVLNTTTVLKLSGNSFRYLHEDSFRRFGALEQLDVSFNNVSSISAVAFENVRLLNLSLRGNQLSELTRGVFNHSRNLRIIDVSFNRLSAIESWTFAPLSALETLDISNNRIAFFAPDSLQFNLRLSQLFLANNALVTLSESAERFLPAGLVKWSLAHNPWHCDCRILWLRTLLQRTNAEYDSAELRCRSGAVASASGELWTSLRYNMFTCAPVLHYPANASVTHVSFPAGSTAVLACRTYSFARSEVVWYKEDVRLNWTAMEGTLHSATDEPIVVSSIQPKYDAWKSNAGNQTTTLTIRRLDAKDVGSYSCVVSNEAGFVIGNYSLSVTSLSAQNVAAAAIAESPLHILAIVAGLFGLTIVIVSALAFSAYLRKERIRKLKLHSSSSVNGSGNASAKANGINDSAMLDGLEQRYLEVRQREEQVYPDQSQFAIANGYGNGHSVESTPKFHELPVGYPGSDASTLTDGSRFLGAFASGKMLEFSTDSRMPSPATIRSQTQTQIHTPRTVTFRFDVDENCPLHGHGSAIGFGNEQEEEFGENDALCNGLGSGENYCPVHSPLSGVNTLNSESKYSTARNGYRAPHLCPVHGDSDGILEHHV